MLGYLKKMTKIDTCRGSESPKNSGHTPLPECSQYSTEASTSYSIPVVENKSKTTIIMNTDDNEAKLFPEGDDDSTYQQEQHGCHLLPASLLKRTTKMDPESGSHKLSPVSRRTPQSNVEPDCEPFQLEILSSKTTSPTTFCPTIASALWRPLWPPGWHPRSTSSATAPPGAASQHFAGSSSGEDGDGSRCIASSGGAGSSTGGHHHFTPVKRQHQFQQKHQQFEDKMSRTIKTKSTHKEVNGDQQEETDIFTNENYEKVEDWLDEHPEFMHSYFVRKASRSLIDNWLLAHSSSMATPGTLSANQPLPSTENSGANTPVRKISAHEFEASGGGYLRPMVSTTCDGTPTFLPIQDQVENGEKAAAPSEEQPTTPTIAAAAAASTSSPMISQYGTPRFRPTIMTMKSREELESIKDEKELIFELLKDICNDLEVKSLCHKILKNVSILTNADRCSLFLVRNDGSSRYLVSQLFDVSNQSTIEQMATKEEIRVPWGTGIVGYVAESGAAVNIPDCYQDSRFTNVIDQKTGYTTRNMLCNPIFDCDGEVMGVAQVINKKCADNFTENDESVFAKYLQFCGIGIRNAQIYERSQLENKRNQVLLDLARMVFEKQSNIENIIYRILIHILSLLQCERCQILLLADEPKGRDFYYYGRSYQDPYTSLNLGCKELQIDSANSECGSSNASSTSETTAYPAANPAGGACSQAAGMRSFYRVFDLEATDLQQPDFEKTRQTPFEGRFPVNIGVTCYVATTGETLNITDAYSDSRFDPVVDEAQPHGFRHKSILCMPIRNASSRIIGVAQLVNKLNGQPFNKNDENLFEAFAIFSGMGIDNTQMFEKAVKAMAKQKVTLELLSYHASAHEQEASKFARMLIPSTSSLSLATLRFDDFSLNEDQMIKACIRMFIDLDLIERFHIDYKVLCKWILSVRKNYRPVLYHNWRHAFNVAQMMFAIFVNTSICLVLGELETLALIVACLCHDLDHRGTNNSFQIKTSSPLAELYSTSTLEHHHFDQSLMILNSQGNQILSNLSPDDYRRVVYVLEEAILATDLAIYFQKRDDFFELVNNQQYDNWTNEKHRSLLRSMLMTCCDIAAITKPWEIQKIMAELVASEFFHQGDIEKEQLNIEPIDMMNREKKDELPKMQMSFIDSICLPIYQAFAKLCPQQLKVLLKGVISNREAWTLLSNQPYQLNIRSPSDLYGACGSTCEE